MSTQVPRPRAAALGSAGGRTRRRRRGPRGVSRRGTRGAARREGESGGRRDAAARAFERRLRRGRPRVHGRVRARRRGRPRRQSRARAPEARHVPGRGAGGVRGTVGVRQIDRGEDLQAVRPGRERRPRLRRIRGDGAEIERAAARRRRRVQAEFVGGLHPPQDGEEEEPQHAARDDDGVGGLGAGVPRALRAEGQPGDGRGVARLRVLRRRDPTVVLRDGRARRGRRRETREGARRARAHLEDRPRRLVVPRSRARARRRGRADRRVFRARGVLSSLRERVLRRTRGVAGHGFIASGLCPGLAQLAGLALLRGPRESRDAGARA